MTTSFKTICIIGSLAAGAVAGTLFSPKAGKVNRRFLAMKARTFSKKLTKKTEITQEIT